jgi:peptidoglycan/xylan/chitin deacetylase (PgdA/CDA1 family)
MRIYKTRVEFTALPNTNIFPGTVCTITDEVTNPMYVYQGEAWNSIVTAETNPVTGGISIPNKNGIPIITSFGDTNSAVQNFQTAAPVVATDLGTIAGTTIAGTGATYVTDPLKIDGVATGKFTLGSASPGSVMRTDGLIGSDGQVCLSVYIPDYSKVTQISIKIGDAGFANSFVYSYSVSANTNNQYNGVHRIYADKSKFTVLGGSPVWGTTAFSRVMAEVSGVTDGTCVVYIGQLMKSGLSQANIIWTWDDGYYEMFSNVFQYTKGKNFPMTSYVIGGSLYTADSDKLTIAQMQEMYDAGWDIANHAFNHTDQGVLGDTAYVSDKEKMANWLAARGFTRRGMNFHHAYVGGVYAATTAALMDQAGFMTCRTIAASRHMPTWAGVGNRMVVDGGLQLNNTLTLAQAKAKVDAAIQNGGTLIIVGHRVQATAGSIHWATTDFQSLVDYIAAYRDAGQCNIKAMSEWFAGLSGRP